MFRLLAAAATGAAFVPLLLATPAQATVPISGAATCTPLGLTAAAASVTLDWTRYDASERPTKVEFIFAPSAPGGYYVKATVRTTRSDSTDMGTFTFNAKATNAPTTVDIRAWNSQGGSVYTNLGLSCGRP